MKLSSAFLGTGLDGSFFMIFSAGSLLCMASWFGSYVAGPTTSAVSSLLGSTILCKLPIHHTWDRGNSIMFDVARYSEPSDHLLVYFSSRFKGAIHYGPRQEAGVAFLHLSVNQLHELICENLLLVKVQHTFRQTPFQLIVHLESG